MKAYEKRFLGVMVLLNLLLFIYIGCVSLIDNQKYFQHINRMKSIYAQSDNNIVPNENFIFLKKYIFKNKDGRNCDPEKSDEICSIEEIYTTASGISIDSKGNELQIHTAAHWCYETFLEDLSNTDISENGEYITATYYYQADFFGESYKLKIIDIDLKTDLCLAKIESPYANQARRIKVSNYKPEIGEKVYAISAPQGVASHKTRLHFEGKFAGCDENMVDMPFCFYTMPASPGSSGSGILNEAGELIGILSISIQGFDNVSGGPNPYVIDRFLKENNWF